MALPVEMAAIQTIAWIRQRCPHSSSCPGCCPTCTANKKNVRFHPVPLTQYLLATVMRILLPQYDTMASTGLLRLTLFWGAMGGAGELLREA